MDDASDFQLLHQSGHSGAGDVESPVLELLLDLWATQAEPAESVDFNDVGF